MDGLLDDVGDVYTLACQQTKSFVLIVILDTCEYHSDFWMRGRSFKYLIAATRSGFQVVMPEVVRAELLAGHKREHQKWLQKYHRLLAGARKVFDPTDGLPLPSNPKKGTLDAYEKFLKRAVKGLKIRIEPIPEIPHTKLVEMAASRTPPFDSQGQGYRDALVWETVLATCRRANKDVAFISGNTRDFAAGERKGQRRRLNPELARTVAELKPFARAHRLLYFESLGAFVDEMSAKFATPHEGARLALERGKFDGLDLKKWLKQQEEELLLSRDWTSSDVGVDVDVIQTDVLGFDRIGSIAVNKVDRLRNDDLMVEFTAPVELDFSFTVRKSDARSIEDPDVEVDDWNWSPIAALASVRRRRLLSTWMMYNPSERNTLGADIIEVSGLLQDA